MHDSTDIIVASSMPTVTADLSGVTIHNSTPAMPQEWFFEAVRGGMTSDSGVTVNGATAPQYSSVYQAVSMISADIAGLPFDKYVRDDDGEDRELVRDRTWDLLNVSADDGETSSLSLRESLQADALLWGNGFAEIRGDTLMRLPPQPSLTSVERVNGQLIYQTREEVGVPARQLTSSEVFHLRGLGDGVSGWSVITLARNSFGLGLAGEKHGNRTFKNNARPNIALKTAAKLNETQANDLRSRFENRHAGLDRESSVGVLSGGLDLVTYSIPNEDAQWLENRKFQRQEVAAWFSIPPSRLNDETPRSYNSAEADDRFYLKMTLMRWIRKWQCEANLKLLSRREQRGRNVFFEMNTASFQQGDIDTTTNMLTNLVDATIMSPNEARHRLNMNSRPGGDEFQNPNITPGSSSDESTEDDDDTDDFQNLLEQRLASLLNSERKTAKNAQSRVKDFPAWWDKNRPQVEERMTSAMQPICAILKRARVDVSPVVLARDAAGWVCDSRNVDQIANDLTAIAMRGDYGHSN